MTAELKHRPDCDNPVLTTWHTFPSAQRYRIRRCLACGVVAIDQPQSDPPSGRCER